MSASNIYSNGIIELNRNDTLEFPLYVTIETGLSPAPFEMQDGDILEFSVVAPNTTTEDPYILKEYTSLDLDENNCVNIFIESTDTLLLDACMYYWQVKLKYTRDGKDYVNTIVSRKQFRLYN